MIQSFKQKFLIAAMMIMFIFAGSSFGADVDLGEGYHVPAGFSSILITSSDGKAIQHAVERIQNGGTILLSGNFKLKNSINIKKNLTIKGLDSAVLDASKIKDRVIRCQGNITLENLTITGGISSNGGGVKVDGGDVKIINCNIHNNKGLLGGAGLHVQAKTLTLTSCDISNNTVALLGGGISFAGGEITMTNCNIRNNTAQFQGGGFAAAGSKINMNNCKITDNNASVCGGGVFITVQTTLTAKSSDISNNIAPVNADLYIDSNCTYSIN